MANNVVDNVLGGAIEIFGVSSRKLAYRTDPVLWTKEVLGIHLWSKQREVANSVRDHKRTAVKSAHDMGKSKVAAILACWWIATHNPGEAIVITTAPTYQQVHGIIWREMGKHHQIANENGQPLPGYITGGDKWNIIEPDGTLFQAGWGRKPADSNLHGFQGVHERYVLVIIDEACGIAKSLWTAVEAITTTGDARILAIGNPDDPNTYFGSIFNDSRIRTEWDHITISALDSPNITQQTMGLNSPDKDLPDYVRPFLIQPETVESWRRQWGEEDPRWKSKILGEFPDQSSNSLFSQSIIDRGVETWVKPYEYARPIMGVDLARFGDNFSTAYTSIEGEVWERETNDKNDIIERSTGKRGIQIRFVKEWSKADAVESTNIIHRLALEHAVSEVRIDTAGYGAGVYDQVARLAQTTYRVTQMNGSGPTPDLYRWINARAWWHDTFAEGLRNGTIDILYEDEKLKNDLLGIQYHFKNRYRALQVESKDDMATRGVESPDHSDAAIYAAAPITVNEFTGMVPGQKFAMDTEFVTGVRSSLGAY